MRLSSAPAGGELSLRPAYPVEPQSEDWTGGTDEGKKACRDRVGARTRARACERRVGGCRAVQGERLWAGLELREPPADCIGQRRPNEFLHRMSERRQRASGGRGCIGGNRSRHGARVRERAPILRRPGGNRDPARAPEGAGTDVERRLEVAASSV